MAKSKTVMVVDYDDGRRGRVGDLVKHALGDVAIEGVRTTKRNDRSPQNVKEASILARRKFDFVVYNTMSNPSPKLYIEEFKRKFPKSHVLLYTDLPKVNVDDFNRYRLADGMVKITDAVLGDPKQVELVEKAIQDCEKDSTAVKLSWVEQMTKRAKRWSNLIRTLIGIAGLVIGFIVGDIDRLAKWYAGTPQPPAQATQQPRP